MLQGVFNLVSNSRVFWFYNQPTSRKFLIVDSFSEEMRLSIEEMSLF